MRVNPVFLYIPNLIGYGRIVLAFFAVTYAHDYWFAGACYVVSQLLDAVDGVVARHFNQTSQFGSVLDMLTDRISSMCLMMLLAQIQREKAWMWFGLIILDITSHWLQMFSKLGSGQVSHKINDNPILAFYYSFPWLLLFCLGNEAFFVSTYLNEHVETVLFTHVYNLSIPFFLCKQFFNVVQLYDSVVMIAAKDDPRHAPRRSPRLKKK